MLLGKVRSEFDRLKFRAASQTVIIVVLGIGLTVNGFLLWSMSRSKRTIIIPSTVLAQIEVSDIDASPQYIRINTAYALSLLYSYTPASAAARFEEFLVSFVVPDKAQELRTVLLERLRQIQSVKVSESIEIEELVFEQRGALLVRSKIYRYTLGHPIATDPLYLRILYRITDGNLKISSILNLNAAEYARLVRAQQIDGKKMEERDKQRERRAQKLERDKELEVMREEMQSNQARPDNWDEIPRIIEEDIEDLEESK